MNVFAADSREEAAFLSTSMLQAFAALRFGKPGKLPLPVEGYRETLAPHALAALDHVMQYSVIGTADDVREKLHWFQELTGVDEIIIAGAMHDPAARMRSLHIIRDSI